MKHFAVFLPMKDEEKSKQHRAEHLDYLANRAQEGNIFAKGRFVDGAGGLIIYIAKTFSEVKQMVEQDPYVVTGARGFEIHEWEMTSEPAVQD